MIFNVSNAAQLQTALASARGGDTISLAAGNYGKVSITSRNYSSAITIKSAVGTTAHFDRLLVEKSSFINFESLDLGSGLAAGEPEYTKLATVENSSNIKMIGVSIHGSIDNNPSNDGIGLFVNKVNGFELTDSNVEQVFRGVLVQQSYNVEVSDTRFDEMRSDGINIAAVRGVTLEGNSFTDFRPVGSDHADAIQFWNVGQPFGSRDIVIKNNVIMNGTGTGPQGIFMNAANGWDYANVLIENNMIYSNDSYHGIHIEGGNNVRIVGNTTLSHQLDRDYMWINVADVHNINISNNLTERLIIGAGVTGLTQSNNQSFWTNPLLKSQIPNLNYPKTVSDLIIPNVGYQAPNGDAGDAPPVPAPPPPTEQLVSVYGTAAPWETLQGSTKNERLYGMPESHAPLGAGTRDKIYGGGGADLFVLGDERGLFYDDKSAVSAGRADHAAILDFGADDKIQLVGALSDYVLTKETINGILGTSIFRDDNRNGKYDALDEYIAHVSGSSTALALNAAHFTFVTNVTSNIDALEAIEQMAVAPMVEEIDTPAIADFTVSNLPAPVSSFTVDYFTALA
jgi:preprotein translocase subunit YajC